MLSGPGSVLAVPAPLGRLYSRRRARSHCHGISPHEAPQEEHPQGPVRGCHEITQQSTSQC